jgi:hypothetical protein
MKSGNPVNKNLHDVKNQIDVHISDQIQNLSASINGILDLNNNNTVKLGYKGILGTKKVVPYNRVKVDIKQQK